MTELTLQLRYPGIIYTKEGQDMQERLWEETMKELKFAGVEEILAQM